MRIAFIVSTFPSLSETFILNQITGLLDMGHQVDIFASTKGNQSKVHEDVYKYNLLSHTRYSGMPRNKLLRVLRALGLFFITGLRHPVRTIISLNLFKYGKNALNLTLFYRTLSFSGKGPYDVVHCHFGPNGNLGAFLWRNGVIKGKLITTFHGHDMSGLLQEKGNHIYNLLFDEGDLFLPISERWKAKLIDLGCDRRKVIVHRMGIDTGRFQFTARHPEDSGRISLLTVARFVEKKGIEYSVRAVARLIGKYPMIEYNIAGDGPLRENMEELVDGLSCTDNINFLGWQQQDEIAELMQNSHLLIAPSVTSQEGDQEGIPVVLMEALARGLPVVSTLHSGIPEIVEDGESGFLVPERDVDALAEKLEYLIEHPEIWPEMGRAGRKFVEENYDIKKLNRRLVGIYEQLLFTRVEPA
jgi:colanic acid/amylovoran biosynthesis glycosyltransferase